jgi:hypothetical protein
MVKKKCVRVTVHIPKETMDFVRSRSFNRYAESDSAKIRNCIFELEKTVFRVTK